MIRHHEAQRVHLPLANPRHLLLRRLERVSACCRLGQNQVILRIRLFEVPARGVRLLLRGGAALARLGLAPLGCAVVVAMFSGPLMVIKEVIDTKSTKNLPFPMAIATVVNCSLWLGFGLLVIDDPFVWFPNVLGLGSGIAQLALFAKYGFHTEADKKDEAE